MESRRERHSWLAGGLSLILIFSVQNTQKWKIVKFAPFLQQHPQPSIKQQKWRTQTNDTPSRQDLWCPIMIKPKSTFQHVPCQRHKRPRRRCPCWISLISTNPGASTCLHCQTLPWNSSRRLFFAARRREISGFSSWALMSLLSACLWLPLCSTWSFTRFCRRRTLSCSPRASVPATARCLLDPFSYHSTSSRTAQSLSLASAS